MTEPLRIQLLPHVEKIARHNPFPPEAVERLLYHQQRTYEALRSHALVVNSYNTGTGKTRAALLHLLDQKDGPQNLLFIAPTNELIAQHQRDIETFVKGAGLQYHVIHVDAKTLRALPTREGHERVGERLAQLLQNPREYGWDGRKALVVVTNPDIFYYVLYFAAYRPTDRRNLFEQFLLRFNYIVIDEFHYYTPKQLAAFLFYFVLCREFGYFTHGRRICLLSATPEPQIKTYLQSIFSSDEMAWIEPGNEPPDSADLLTTPVLAPLTLEVQQLPLDEYTLMAQAQLRAWLDEGQDGALISGALRRINLAHTTLKPTLVGRMARITGAEQTEQRRAAPRFPLILATPTVDIGYNFDKPGKTRQPLDFVIFDARTPDQFLQRLGRAGRVLGRSQTDIPAHATALVDETAYLALQALNGQTLTRSGFFMQVRELFPPRRDLYAYLSSYAVMETLRPIFNLKQTLRPDLHEWLKQLFDGVLSVFAPNTRRWHYGHIEGFMRRHEKLERIIWRKEEKLLAEMLDEFVQWHKWQPSAEQYTAMRSRMIQPSRFRDEVHKWVEEQYALNEALFSFREALPTPQACVYDSNHLLAEADVTTYDALHVAANYEVDWFEDEKDFAAKTGQPAEKAAVYGRLRDHRSPKLRLSFSFTPTVAQEDFDKVNCRRPVTLKGLRLNADAPLDSRVRRVFAEEFVPLLIVRDGSQEERALWSKLRDTNIFSWALNVRFDDVEKPYTAVVGSAAFTLHAEMEGVLWRIERRDEHQPIFS